MGIFIHFGISQYDNQLLNVHIIILYFSGIILSTFEEYLFLAVAATCIKPGLLFLALWRTCNSQLQMCSSNLLLVVLEQQGLLLFLGIGVNWLIHCDRRKDWLLSQRAVQINKTLCTIVRATGSDVELQNSAFERVNGDGYGPENASATDQAQEEAATMTARMLELMHAEPPSWRRTDRLLGRGAAGRVFRARVEGTAEQCAVKLVSDAEPPPTERAAAERQLRALAAVRHPNLVEYRAAVLRDGGAALLMTLCDGGSLAQLLARRGALGEAEARPLARQVAAGLSFLHRHGAVHLRLTCGNCLLCSGGGGGGGEFTVRLSDYWVAGAVSRWRRGAALEGAFWYSAPEVLRGAPCGRKVRAGTRATPIKAMTLA